MPGGRRRIAVRRRAAVGWHLSMTAKLNGDNAEAGGRRDRPLEAWDAGGTTERLMAAPRVLTMHGRGSHGAAEDDP